MLRTRFFMLGKVSKHKEEKTMVEKWKGTFLLLFFQYVYVLWQSVQELPEEAAQRQGLVRAPTYKCPQALDGCRVLTGEGQGEQHFQQGCQVGLGLLEPGALRHL